VADAGGLDLDQHLAGARAVEVDGLDGERLATLRSKRVRVWSRVGSPAPKAVKRQRASAEALAIAAGSRRRASQAGSMPHSRRRVGELPWLSCGSS
jgi:hypothetical protein